MSKYRDGIPAGFEGDEDYIPQNLKITIVPDIIIGAGLNGDDFDAKLGADMINWFDAYKERWNAYKRTPAAQQSLKVLFMNDKDPLLLALKLFACCPGCNNLKNKNLALFILETICDLHKTHPDISTTCDDNTRMVAFNFVRTCGVVALYKAVMETFELYRIRDLLVPKLKELIADGHFKDAAYWTMYLRLTHLFSIFDVIFPLILQDKVFLAEEYLSVAKEGQQLATVQFLDSLLDKQKTVYEHCDEILTKYQYKDVKFNVLSYRPMSKLVTRLAKKYKIDAHLTPNLNFTKACSYMHYLFHKYQDGGMSKDSWRELVRDAASTKALQLNLVSNVASYNDVTEAIYWAKYFKVPHDECPSVVREKLQDDDSATSVEAESNWNSSNNADLVDGAVPTAVKAKKSNSIYCSNFLQLELPIDSIILIDRKEEFLEMLTYLEEQLLIAFDSEWKPSVYNENVVSLLQLATIQRVYLLDCLSKHLSDDLWQQLGRRIFNNLEILKIGFSLHMDLRMLQKSLPLHLNLQTRSCYLDLSEMWRRLKYMQIVAFPFGNGMNAGESLCALTELCLGKKLDKSNQCSNWANRPLRHDQIVYAALDAHCLLLVYQVLSKLLLSMGLDIDQVVDEITTAKTGYLYRMKRSVSVQNDTEQVVTAAVACSVTGAASLESTNISATEIKFICDNMLLGLSKELRKLGIDCIDITNTDLTYYIELAKRENRYILTRDTRYTLFVNELPQTQCIQIPTDTSVEQVINVVSYLNIAVNERNLFTRCLLCNGNEFILALKDEMQLMRFGQLRDTNEQTLSAKINPYERTFQLLNVNDHIISTRTTYSGKPIKLNRIKPHILRTKEHFFICDNCGVCTWDGAHPLHRSIMNYIATDTPAPTTVSHRHSKPNTSQ